MTTQTDYLIIGAGIMGLTIAREIKQRKPQASILMVEKEDRPGFHASGRNSGVLHAGFYYTADSLKARFCREGNKRMRDYCTARGLTVAASEKVVVATSPAEVPVVLELEKRGRHNGVNVQVVDEKQLAELEPNAKTVHHALYSPDTATVNPWKVCEALAEDIKADGVKIRYGVHYKKRLREGVIELSDGIVEAGCVINCAGLYADAIAREFGFSQDYTIIPFKGVYLQHNGVGRPLRKHLYGVPNLKNPFLGAHFGLTVEGGCRIGPTAMPAFWREQYHGLSRLKLTEFFEIMGWETKLFVKDAFHFRSLAWEEIKKYHKPTLVAQAAKKTKHLNPEEFDSWSRPGIRAQLLNIHTYELLQDFVVEGDSASVHVLNAVSPAFTSSMPFADWVVEKYVMRLG